MLNSQEPGMWGKICFVRSNPMRDIHVALLALNALSGKSRVLKGPYITTLPLVLFYYFGTAVQ